MRPWSERFFRLVCGDVFGGARVTFASDFRGCGDVPWAREIDRRYGQVGEEEWPSHLDQRKREDITMRCRLLRSLPPERAKRLLRATAGAVEQLLDQERPELVVSTSIDSYVLDLLFAAARARRVPFFGISPVIISGYFLITARGEYNGFREPDDLECEQVLTGLVDRQIRSVYTAPYATSELAILRRWLREVAKMIYFPLRRSVEPLNYHFWGSARLARARIVPTQLFPSRFFDSNWKRTAAAARRPLVYLPLQCSPEFNSDYWPPHPDFQQYEAAVLDVLDAIGDAATVLVKEHSYMLGFRPSSYYRMLRSRSNVVLVPPRVTSNELFELCDVVATSTGSPGIEAVLHGRPVLTFGEPYYAAGRVFHNVRSRSELQSLGEEVQRLSRLPRPTSDEKLALVRRVLAACLPGDGEAILDGTERRESNALQMISSLRAHLARWHAWAMERQVAA